MIDEQELTRRRFEEGALILFKNIETISKDKTFGMDLFEWSVGPKFRGFKLVPPGLHFLLYSTSASDMRMGLFRFYHPRQDHVLNYDPLTEDFYSEPSSSIALNRYELDACLGPYPVDDPSLTAFKKLSRHIKQEHLDRFLPRDGLDIVIEYASV